MIPSLCQYKRWNCSGAEFMEIFMTKSKNKIAPTEVKPVSTKKPLKIINRSDSANVAEVTTQKKQSKKPAEQPQAKSINQLTVNDNNEAAAQINHKLPKPASKQAILINLLQSLTGATVHELAAATSWQKHSVHGVMSGVLKKKLGLAITSSKEERGLVYRIVKGEFVATAATDAAIATETQLSVAGA